MEEASCPYGSYSWASPIETFFPAPVVSEISDFAGLQIYRGVAVGARAILLPNPFRT